METRLRSLRQQIKQHRVAIQAVTIILIITIALIIVGYRFDWTGFNGSNKSAKTLWDWLQLLIIPFVLAVGGLWFSQIQKDREQKKAEQRIRSEQEIAQDNQQEVTLQEYINKLSELLLDRDLCKSTVKDEVRKVARVRTLTVLPRLNGRRKGIVLQFLYEAQLINGDDIIVDLTEADLTGVDLARTNLTGANLHKTILIGAFLLAVNMSRANLSGADFRDANLEGANLSNATLCGTSFYATYLAGANLSGANLGHGNLCAASLNSSDLSQAILFEANLNVANLSGAKFRGTDLSGANLKDARNITPEELEQQAKSLKGATMPDGSIHP